MRLAPRLSLTCGNLCGMHHPTALLDKSVGNIRLLSVHAIRLWVFLALEVLHRFADHKMSSQGSKPSSGQFVLIQIYHFYNVLTQN